MIKIRDMTIKSKLTVVMMVASAAAVALSCVIFMTSSFILHKKEHLEKDQILAELTGVNCQAALMFDVSDDAEKMLSSLAADRSIMFACIYTAEGEVFAVYNKESNKPDIDAPELEQDGYEYSEGYLRLFHDILFDDKVIGRLYLQDDQKDVYASFRWDVVTLGFVMLITLAIAYLIASKLQSLISSPILSLAETAEEISRTEDYSIRAEKHSEDEVGVLIDSFNLMLNEIQEREASLAESEERFRMLVETSSDWIWEVDANGVYTYASPKVKDLLGFEPEEITGKTPLELMPQEEADRVAEQFAELSRTKSSFAGFENINLHKDGHRVILETSATPHLDDSGQLLGYRGIDRDITDRKRSEEALVRSESRFRSLAQTAGIAIISADSQGRVVFWNPAAEKMFGYSSQEILNEPITRIMPERYRETHTKGLKRVVTTGKTMMTDRVIELYGLRKGEQEFPLEISLSRWQTNEGLFFTAILNDITDRKVAEEALRLDEARLEVLVELNQMTEATEKELVDFALEQAIQLTKSKIGYVAFTNEDETLFSMFSWSKTVMSECMIVEGPLTSPVAGMGLLGEAIRQRRPVITNDYQDGEPARKGYPAGHVQIKRHMNIPVFDSRKIIAVAGVANKEDYYNDSDVRQLTLLMDGVWRIILRNRIEDERKNLLKTLASKNEELESIVYTASHDLRSPLVNIDGFSSELANSCQEVTDTLMHTQLPDSIEESVMRTLNEDIPASLKYIRTSATKMDMLMRGLLKLSRLGREAVDIVPLDMNELIDNISLGMQHQIKKHDVELVVGDLAPCLGDKGQVSQVFTNLLDNAIKYMDPERKGEIRVSCEYLDGENVYAVCDNGVGIDEEFHHKIFEIFHRLDPAGPVSGEGIGLTIVKRIIDRHNGRIWMESTVDEGTTFYVAIPAISNKQ